jgi:hypothetical protein
VECDEKTWSYRGRTCGCLLWWDEIFNKNVNFWKSGGHRLKTQSQVCESTLPFFSFYPVKLFWNIYF